MAIALLRVASGRFVVNVVAGHVAVGSTSPIPHGTALDVGRLSIVSCLRVDQPRICTEFGQTFMTMYMLKKLRDMNTIFFPPDKRVLLSAKFPSSS